MWVASRAFRHRRQRGGLFGSKLLKKAEADRALSMMLRELAQGDFA